MTVRFVNAPSMLAAAVVMLALTGAAAPQDRPGGNGTLPGDPGYSGSRGPSGWNEPAGRWISKSGAIATDGVRGILGEVMNVGSEEEAGALAMALCRQRGGDPCKVQVTFSNQCVSLVTGAEKFSVQLGRTEAEASQTGMQLCGRESDTNCHVFYSGCALPIFVSN